MNAGQISKTPQRFASPKEAESEAAIWLRRLPSRSRFEWKRDSPDTLVCVLADKAPAQVVAGTYRSESEWCPSLWFTVGVKYEGRYWQGRVGEWDRQEYFPMVPWPPSTR
ncbi:MAG: hypothetical protein F4Y75_05010 [Acidimicrobiia bacterium]|nr:hypothetical protein [bacterium]MCY3579578.1 hypothetical protein [bacterium]MDE0643317.1 hypothetical protein [bacterium]MXZ06856.1 hypothetical protein [Acidimicrobiia bacterium]MYH54562.1 hypothetical protein [Acidimicrobiia bacterium]